MSFSYWTDSDGRPTWEPPAPTQPVGELPGSPYDFMADWPTEWDRANHWWHTTVPHPPIKQAIMLTAYRSVVAARQLHNRIANLGDRLRQLFLMRGRGGRVLDGIGLGPTRPGPSDRLLGVSHLNSPCVARVAARLLPAAILAAAWWLQRKALARQAHTFSLGLSQPETGGAK